jgi:prevent-host-death family protein
MKSIDEADAQARLDEVLDEAQRQQIVIRRQDRDQAIVVSVADYERLRLANTGRFFDAPGGRRRRSVCEWTH